MKIRTGAIAVLCRMFLVLLMCAAPAAARAAANVTLTETISPTGTYPVVDGYTVLMQGSGYSLQYKFAVSTTQTPTAVEGTYNFGNGRSGDLFATVSGSTISVSPLKYTNLPAADYKMTYSLKITYSNGSSETVNGSYPTGIRIITAASSSVAVTELEPVLTNTQVTLGPITMTGGNPSGWSVVWSEGTPTGTNKASCRYTPKALEYKVNTVTATVTNSVAGTELYREVYTFSIPTYATATATISDYPKAVYGGSPMTLHCDTGGGNPDGWHFQWDGKAGTDSPDYTFTVSENKEGQTSSNVVATNLTPGGTQLASITTYANYYVYKKPTVVFSDVAMIQKPNTALNLSMATSGGDAQSWSYEWTVNGSRYSTASSVTYHTADKTEVLKIVGKAVNNAPNVAAPFVATKEYVIVVVPDGGSSSAQTENKAMYSGSPVKLNVDLPEIEGGWVYQWWIVNHEAEGELASGVNEIEFNRNVSETEVFDVICRATATIDGKPVDVDTHFLVTVYPTPSASITYVPDYVNVIPGETIVETLNVAGGSADAWSYNWEMLTSGGWKDFAKTKSISLVIPSYNSNVFEDSHENYKDYYIRGNAINSPDGVGMYCKSFDRRYNVYPTPAFNFGNTVYNMVSGSPLEISVDAVGGQRWTFEWIEDGSVTVGNTSTLSVTPVNEGTSRITKTYKVVAECLLDTNDGGSRVVAHKEQYFTVNVYPEDVARWSERYPANIISGTQVPLSISFSDGNANNWNVSWYLNDAPIPGANGPSYTFVNTAAKDYIVKAVVTNKTIEGLSAELTQKITVYPQPTVTVATDTYYVKTGTSTTLEVDAQGAAEWHYQWYKNDQEIGDDQPSLTFTAENGGFDVVHDTYHVNASSFLPGGEQVGTETKYFTVDVYPDSPAKFDFATYPTMLERTSVNINISLADRTPSNWNIAWYVNGVLKSGETGTSFDFLPLTPGTYVVSAELSSRLSSNLDITLTTNEIVVYATPKTSVDKDTYYAVSGNPVTMKFNVSGGDKWSIKWYENEMAESGYLETTDVPELTVTLENTGETVIYKTYWADVTGTIPGATVLMGTHYQFTVAVYPEATAHFEGDIPTNVIVNTPVDFNIAFADNNPDNWNVTWYVNEDKQPASGPGYTFKPTQEGSYTIFAELESKLDAALNTELAAPAIHAYGEPNVIVAKDTYYMVSGSELILSIYTNGGASWKYKWTEDGNPIAGEEPVLYITPVNDGSAEIVKTYEVEASCYLPGDELVTTKNVKFTVTVYPTETARFAEVYPAEILVGKDVPMSVLVADGNLSNWQIEWYVSGYEDPIAEGSEYNFSSWTPGVYEVRAVFVSKIEESLTFSLSHVFQVFATPTLQPTPSAPEYFRYSNGDNGIISFTETVKDGFPDGWSWKVTYDDDQQLATGTGTSATYNYIVPIVTEPVSEVVKIIFTNTNGSDYTQNFEVTKTVNVWPEFKFDLTASPDKNKVAIGSEISFSTSHSEAPGNWTYEWTVDGSIESDFNAYYFHAPAELENMQEYTIAVKGTLTSEYEGMSRETTLSRTIEVWPDGTITSDLVQTTGIAPGMPLEIGVEVIGTLEGWTFEWTRDGVAFENNTPAWNPEFTEAEIGSTVVFTVHATFVRDESVEFDDTFTINVRVFNLPTCSIGENILAYIGGTATQTISYSGLNPDGWHAEWYVFGQTGEGPAFEFSIPENLTSGDSSQNYVRLYNEYAGSILYDENFYFFVTAYSKGEAYYESRPTNPDFLYQASEPIVIRVDGGYPEGWTYRWYSTDGGFDVMGGPSFTPETVNTGDSNMPLMVYVEITNSIGSEVGYNATGSYEYILWPQAKVGSPELSRRNIRNGDNVTLNVNRDGANPDGWNYTWRANGNFVSNNQQVTYVPVPLTSDTPSKNISTFDYNVQVSNYGPQNQSWFTQTTASTGLNVYNRPAAPTELLVKGDGTSRTLIAMMSQNDETLQTNGYSFVFGYSDGNGDHALNPTTNRYNHFDNITTTQFNNLRYDMWVYSQWTYPDGSVITSGKRYLNGYDDTFDASVYAGGRGDTAGIEAVEVGDIWSDGYSFRAEPSEPSAAMVKVYSASGQIVRVFTYPQQCSFDERIEFGGLAAGMYIVEIQAGNLRAVKKVVVDNK